MDQPKIIVERRKVHFNEYCLFWRLLFSHSQRKFHITWNLAFTDQLQNLVPTSTRPSKVLSQKMSLPHPSQLLLSVQFLSASINALCFNSSKMFIIGTLPSAMRSSQRMMKPMSSFNTRAIPLVRHFDKFWLKKLIFLTMNPFLGAFQWLYFGFSIFLVISLNYRLMKIGITYTKSEFRVLADINDGVFCHDS